jgi:hypothetical protein
MKSAATFSALCLVATLSGAACSSTRGDAPASASELRPLGQAEVLEDLDALGQALRFQYGGLELKKARFGFDLDAELALARSKIQTATTEGDRIRPLYELLAKLKDGGIALTFRLHANESVESSLPFSVVPVQDAYYVQSTTSEAIHFSDKLVAIDGISTEELERRLLPLTEVGTREATRHRVAAQLTARPFYAPADLRPHRATARVTLERANGAALTVDVPWGSVAAPSPLTDEFAPFYLTAPVREALGLIDVWPKTETLTRFGLYDSGAAGPLPDAGAPGDAGTAIPDFALEMNRSFYPLRGYTYHSGGKTILLVRISSFDTKWRNYGTNVGWLGALLSDHLGQDSPADVVVIDVTRNPGGQASFAQGIASLFTTKPIANTVEASRANRLLVDDLLTTFLGADPAAKPIWKQRLDDAQAACDKGDFLAPFAPVAGVNLGPTFPFVGVNSAGSNMLPPHPLVQWSKPVLLLQDALSSSTTEAFAALLEHGTSAKSFGARTAGSGGTRKSVTLPNSAATFQFPTGLFGPYEEKVDRIHLVENDGVTPDYPYDLSAYDLRGGYVGYAAAFSTVAAGLVSK